MVCVRACAIASSSSLSDDSVRRLGGGQIRDKAETAIARLSASSLCPCLIWPLRVSVTGSATENMGNADVPQSTSFQVPSAVQRDALIIHRQPLSLPALHGRLVPAHSGCLRLILGSSQQASYEYLVGTPAQPCFGTFSWHLAGYLCACLGQIPLLDAAPGVTVQNTSTVRDMSLSARSGTSPNYSLVCR